MTGEPSGSPGSPGKLAMTLYCAWPAMIKVENPANRIRVLAGSGEFTGGSPLLR
jgi:hypothetical protein